MTTDAEEQGNFYKARISKTRTSKSGRISCEMSAVTLWATDEDDARRIITEEIPDFAIDCVEIEP